MGKPRRPGRGPAGRVLAGLLLVLGIAAAGGSRVLHSSGVESARAAAEDRAVAYADAVVAPMLDTALVAEPIVGSDQLDLLAAIGRSIRSEGVARVRLWSSSGQLLFSTDKQDTIGSKSGPEVRTAAKESGTIASGVELEDVGKVGQPLYRTLVPMRVGSDPAGAVTQVDQPLDSIDEQAREPAATVQVAGYVTGTLGVLLLLVSLVMGRTGKGKAGGFHPTAPKPAVVADPSSVAAKLDKSEAAREALEEQLAQLRIQVSQGGQQHSERTRALEAHIQETADRAREMEMRLRDADGRVEESDRVAKDALHRAEEAEARALAAVAASDGETLDDPRVPQLQMELAAVRGELEATRARETAAESLQDGPTLADPAPELDEWRTRADRAEARVAELEGVRDADRQRLAASADVAEQATLRIRELEGKLEGSAKDRAAVVSRVRELEEQLADHERRAGEGSTVASEAAERAAEATEAAVAAEERAVVAERRMAEAEGRVETLEELVRGAEERAATAGIRADEADRGLAELTEELERSRAAVREADGSGSELARRADEAEARAREAGSRVAELEGEFEAARIELEGATARVSSQDLRLEELTNRAREAGAETAQAEAAASEGAARARELEHALRDSTASLEAARLAAESTEARAAEASSRADAAEESLLRSRTELEEARTELAIARARGETAEQEIAAVRRRTQELETTPAGAATEPHEPHAVEERHATGPRAMDTEAESLRAELEQARAESASKIAELEAAAADLAERADGAETRLRMAYAEAEAAKAELDVGREQVPVEGDTPDAERLRAELAAETARADAAEERRSQVEAELASLRGIGLQVQSEDESDEGPSLRYRLARSAEAKKRTSLDPDRTRT